MLLETIRCEEGAALHLTYHQRRLEHSLKTLGLDVTYDLSTLLSPPKTGVWRCRFLYDGTDHTTEYLSYTPRTFTSLRLIRDDTIDYPLKTADRSALDALYAQRNGCDDVLIVRRGLLTDTTIANLALRIGGTWFTPFAPLLKGTTRARLINEGFLHVASLSEADLKNADKIALFNAMMGFVEFDNGIIKSN